jgi:HD-GYP domain-containing protein (c-di-GMP phosphodiesterase class II)
MSRGRLAWITMAATVSALTLFAFVGPFSGRVWEQSQLLFSLTVVSAALCLIGATIVIAIADQREMAEIGLLGTALMAASVLPLVHGLVTPGVFYDQTGAFRTAVFLSIPMAVAVAAPLLVPRSRFGGWAARHWRDWTLLSLLAVFVTGAIVVFFPDAFVAPGPSDPITIVVSVGLVVALGSLSLRQLRFHELGGRPSNLIASLSIALLAFSALLPMVGTDYSPAFWLLHAVGAAGVLGACIGLVVTRRMSRTAQDVLGPVLARDPLAAFELGLSPVVHRFVADLEAKDEITRDHVIRTGEMALRVGERFRLSGPELRDLGLAALLHDVGKLNIPDEILKKPDRLTADEYETVKHHVVAGAEILRADPTLASAADIVRSHHERVDGTGYPDGLAGTDIPLAARIIAVCDAFDAMTHDRQYRAGMPVKLAYSVLQEHAGSQWDDEVIRQVIAVLPTMPAVSSFDDVGRHVRSSTGADELPGDIGELLEAVDAEI